MSSVIAASTSLTICRRSSSAAGTAAPVPGRAANPHAPITRASGANNSRASTTNKIRIIAAIFICSTTIIISCATFSIIISQNGNITTIVTAAPPPSKLPGPIMVKMIEMIPAIKNVTIIFSSPVPDAGSSGDGNPHRVPTYASRVSQNLSALCWHFCPENSPPCFSVDPDFPAGTRNVLPPFYNGYSLPSSWSQLLNRVTRWNINYLLNNFMLTFVLKIFIHATTADVGSTPPCHMRGLASVDLFRWRVQYCSKKNKLFYSFNKSY